MHKATSNFFSSQVGSTWKQSRFLFGVCSEVQDLDFRLKLPLGVFISILMLRFTLFYLFIFYNFTFLDYARGAICDNIFHTLLRLQCVIWQFFFSHAFIIDITFIIHKSHVMLIVVKKKILTNFIFKHLIFCWKEKYLYWLEKYF